MLGVVAYATQRVCLFTYVTWPVLRYHPAGVAQKAATLQLIALGQVGDQGQQRFLDEAAEPLLEKLRTAAGSFV